jgi:hypothetical protein
MKSQPSEPSEPDKERDDLLKQFRACLHLAITAKQTRQDKEFNAMPGPDTMMYCMKLANRPDNTLAVELADSVLAILAQMRNVSIRCENTLRRQDENSVALHATAKRILEQLDFALALILRHFGFINHRAELTECSDLLCEVLYGMAIGHSDAAYLVRRWQEKFPDDVYNEDDSVSDGSFPDSFAWDVYQRVEALDQLADEFPDHIRPAARRMHAWPMLMHRHTNNRRRFQQLAKRLELGAEYPTDASEGARFRPDTPLVRYLDPLIYQLNVTCQETRDMQFKSVTDEQHLLYMTWWTRLEDCPNEDVLAVIHAARLLPPLTKATAAQWAEKAIVPLILATDARDYENCNEPVLQKIAKQKGVKSRAIFKSRLLSAVTATLRRLARPA